ncbi:glycosyl transferases group 1 family protein, partial [Vibrio parahaemolyticus EKP-028]
TKRLYILCPTTKLGSKSRPS